jgi:drug/metabolite transporter (DMT)-like permease
LLIAAVPIVGVLIVRERLERSNALGLLLGLVGVAAIVGVSMEGASLACRRSCPPAR